MRDGDIMLITDVMQREMGPVHIQLQSHVHETKVRGYDKVVWEASRCELYLLHVEHDDQQDVPVLTFDIDSLGPRSERRSVLEHSGVSAPPGSTAGFLPAGSTLFNSVIQHDCRVQPPH